MVVKAHRFHREAFTYSGYSDDVNQKGLDIGISCNYFVPRKWSGPGIRRCHKQAQSDQNLFVRGTWLTSVSYFVGTATTLDILETSETVMPTTTTPSSAEKSLTASTQCTVKLLINFVSYAKISTQVKTKVIFLGQDFSPCFCLTKFFHHLTANKQLEHS